MDDLTTLFPDGVSLRIVGYREGGEWVALALEMDLRGYGESFDEARADLDELVKMQISFAVFKGSPEMVWKSAEPAWFARWEEAHRERLGASVLRRSISNAELQLAEMPIPPAHVIDAMKSRFQLAGA